MILRLSEKDFLDVLLFSQAGYDRYKDFYITSERERNFLQDEKSVRSLLKKQACYGITEKDLKGMLIIYKEKGFRPYIKILAQNIKIENDLLKFLFWNYGHEDLYMKIKKENSLCRILPKRGFVFQVNRGQEILFFRKGVPKSKKDGEEYGKD
jgi:hypothetical protein